MTTTQMLETANRYDALAEKFHGERPPARESSEFYHDVALNWRLAAMCVRQVEDAQMLLRAIQ